MNNRRWFVRDLALAASLVLSFTLAACQPATPAPTATPTAAPVATLPSVSAALPAKPVVLEGALTTDSGLQYLELTPGDGASPQVGNLISMHYSASLPDGTELFDTHTDGQPATAVWGRGQLLPGWEEGLGLMKVGCKAKLVLPPDLAFGAEGSNIIPPNSQIIMEVELLSVKPAPQPSTVSADKLQKTASGLQYFDLVKGDGDEATAKSSVTTHYAIWVKAETENQYIFSSEDGEPLQFGMGSGEVFPGWEEGVVGMKVGGKRFLVIPPELALGEQGGGEIPPNATLVMEIRLMEVTQPRVAMQVAEKDYITTASGLKYYDIQVGTGVTPTVGQTVIVHYTGWLLDGTQFDSSIDRGQPFSFQIGQGNVIAGWDEGVGSMKVGGKRQLLIPANLAYGDTGAGSTIPPGATLIFEVELLEVNP